MFIENFGISNYRSFGPDASRLEGFGKVNLFIGKNNSGKSNLLRFLSTHLEHWINYTGGGADCGFDKIDFNRAAGSSDICLEFSYVFDSSKHLSHFLAGEKSGYSDFVTRTLNTIPAGSRIWYQFGATKTGTDGRPLPPTVSPTVRDLISSVAQTRDSFISNQDDENYLARLEDAWRQQFRRAWPDVTGHQAVWLISAHRQLSNTPKDARPDGERDSLTPLSGNGLVETIGTWINFKGEDSEAKTKGRTLTQFVRTVSGYSSANLRVVNADTEIEVEIEDESFALNDLATGLHELVLLAAYCTDKVSSVICLEEPETHLHPTWQRALIEYLLSSTANQYFIASHSAHIIDIPDVRVYQVRRKGQFSQASRVQKDDSLVLALADLGCKASDLLQANYVLWVEGPSDRLYLLHWLNLVAPELKEGVHFSIMHYSGSMLGHLSGKQLDEGLEAFSSRISDSIPIARLNQNFGVVMDSDKTSSSDPTSGSWTTKLNCKEQLEAKNKFAWITDGRTIENYCVLDDLNTAVTKMNCEYMYLPPSSIYQYAFEFKNTNQNKDYDKVALANHYIQVQSELADKQVSDDHASNNSQQRKEYLIGRMKTEKTGKLYDWLMKLAGVIRTAQDPSV